MADWDCSAVGASAPKHNSKAIVKSLLVESVVSDYARLAINKATTIELQEGPARLPAVWRSALTTISLRMWQRAALISSAARLLGLESKYFLKLMKSLEIE